MGRAAVRDRNGLSSTGALVALRIGKAALLQKIRMSERSEFGFFVATLAALPILSATLLRSRKTPPAQNTAQPFLTHIGAFNGI